MEKTIWWHWQNLSKGVPWHGRAWLHFPKGEFNFEWCIGRPAFGFYFNLENDFERSAGLGIKLFFVSLWFTLAHQALMKLIKYPGEFCFYWHDTALWFGLWADRHNWHRDDPWWRQTHAFHMPWKWDHYRVSYLLKDGAWYHDIEGKRAKSGLEHHREMEALPKHVETHPYTYTKNNGEVQNVTATCEVREYESRWGWFKWLPFPSRKRKSMMYDFSEGIGERVNTWKGGVYGSSETMKTGETVLQCLRRVERTRRFD